MPLVVAHLDIHVREVRLALAVPCMDGVGPQRPIVVFQVVVRLHMGLVQINEVSKGF
jgi:hypothetical protein